ncbi:MAG: DUF6781 family protein [Burkholderiales bacterium]
MSTDQASPHGETSKGSGLGADIKRAVELGGDIQETVRDATLKALTKGELDTASLRRVAGEVLRGAAEGAAHRGAEAKDSIHRAIAGLDDAFAKAAEAATLAAKEASGRMREFSSGDLRRAMDNLKGMEATFLDSLRDAAKAGKDVASTTLHAFAEHAANSGSAVGRQVQTSVDQLTTELGRAAEAQFKESMETGRATAALLARAASGFLAGIAEMIETPPGGKAAGSKSSVEKPSEGKSSSAAAGEASGGSSVKG